MEDQLILVTRTDLEKIGNILRYQNGDEFEKLQQELERARIISEDEVPDDLVTMNTKFTFISSGDGKEMTITLVYPSDANFSEGKISVLAPLGSALLGLRVGQTIDWTFPDGKQKQLTILAIHGRQKPTTA